MEENASSHCALKIAVGILRERCQLFQQRIATLEEENLNLKMMCQKTDSDQNSLTQIDSLKRQIATVDEENNQLRNKMKIISQENQQLWANLGKVTNINNSLGSHLNKINSTLTQHTAQHQPLIRSKTFTQDRHHAEDNEKHVKDHENLRLDLEDISLKLMNSMSEVKNEVDSLVQDMNDVEILDDIISSSLGFSFEDDNDDIIDDLKIILEELNYVKNESEKQNLCLKESLENIKIMKANFKCDNCSNTDNKPNETIEHSQDKLLKEETKMDIPEVKYTKIEKMCPVCSRQFSEETFSVFVSHVESHFKSE